ncbi:hypothetical protein SAMN02745218_02698 [Desulfofundulus australicus DSM 11792]|uniref:TubC N-terminal docking domain-containing protein n=1 Tax=Desulfofundulus australicus DSM 11792 TaxID=1121425 RepID=A0A1M5D1F1_9FIRM|nr:hypothetical protein [Desulfofundulus australicus]SHF60849.1 hypothetical protein SAMN02745218_02698 [Desulfofundulus australicus DSM 11792]
MTSPSELVNQLAGHGIALDIKDGQVRAKLPWPPSQAPPEARPLLAELKRHKQEVTAWLRGYVEELGNRYPVHPTRPRCMAAGHCCWVSETDCDLYPLLRDGRLSGLCRERTGALAD